MAEKYYKHPQFGHVYGDNIPTPIVRVAWLSLVTPKAPPPSEKIPNPEAKYQATFILPKTDESVKSFVAAVKAMTDEMLTLFNKGRPAQIAVSSPLKDGDSFDLEKYPYYKGAWVLTASNKNKVPTLDAEKNPIDAATILGGMFCRGVVTAMATATGISYRIQIIQLVKDDGQRFAGGRPDASSYLDVISGDAPVEAPFAGGKTVAAPTVAKKDSKQNALDLI